jgi:hypothetical protein
LECAGGEDLEFSSPISPNLWNGVTVYSRPVTAFVANYQAGNENDLISTHVFGDHKPMSLSQTVRACEIVGGEKVSSLRALLKRYTRISVNSATSSLLTTYMPAHLQDNGSGSVTLLSDADPTAQWCDDFSYFGSMFVFYRGSTRFRVSISTPDASGSANDRKTIQARLVENTPFGRASARAIPGVITTTGYSSTSAQDACPFNIVQTTTSDCMELAIPYYGQDYNVLVQTMMPALAPVSAIAQNIEVTKPGTSQFAAHADLISSLTSYTMVYDRSIGEDAGFSYFISCLPVRDDRLQFLS